MQRQCQMCDRILTDEEIAFEDGKRCYFCIAKIYKDLEKIMGVSNPPPKPEDFGRAKQQQPQDNQKAFRPFGDKERAEFFATYGFDPQPPPEPTVITAYGANEDTFLKLSIGAPATIQNPQLRQRIEDIIKVTLDTVCQIAAFGQVNPAAILGPGSNSNQNPFQ